MKLLITGASGFVGSSLGQYCHSKGILWEGMSLRNGVPQAIEHHADAIVHLAGKAHDLKKTASAEEYFRINTKLTKSLFDRFLSSEIPVFIFMSSVKAVADTVKGVLTEDQHPDPKTPYGSSKLLAEEYILSRLLPEGKRVYILRPCMIHGPANKGNLNLLYKFVKSGIPYPLAAFDNKRSFLSIENLCFVITELVAGQDIRSGVYNVADREPLSTNSIIGMIGEQLSRKAVLFKVNKGLTRLLAGIGDLIPFPIDSEKLEKLTGDFVVSNEKIVNALGKELPVRSADGIRSTIRSFSDSV